MSRETTRKERAGKQRERYLAGEARHPYRHAPSLNSALSEAGGSGSGSHFSGTGVCARCKPVLCRYVDTFKGLVHQGSELKKRKHINPHPKNTDRIHY